MQILARLQAIAILLCCVGSAAAADLRIGFKAELTSADPHVLNGANRNVWVHVYESLVFQDAQLRSTPGLALSWRMLSPKAWEFKLRPGVPFQNGAPLSANDVKYSIERAMNLRGPRTFRAYLRDVARVQVKDSLTVVIETTRVSPTLPENVGMIAICLPPLARLTSRASPLEKRPSATDPTSLPAGRTARSWCWSGTRTTGAPANRGPA